MSAVFATSVERSDFAGDVSIIEWLELYTITLIRLHHLLLRSFSLNLSFPLLILLTLSNLVFPVRQITVLLNINFHSRVRKAM